MAVILQQGWPVVPHVAGGLGQGVVGHFLQVVVLLSHVRVSLLSHQRFPQHLAPAVGCAHKGRSAITHVYQGMAKQLLAMSSSWAGVGRCNSFLPCLAMPCLAGMAK